MSSVSSLSSQGKQAIESNRSIFSPDEQKLIDILLSLDQSHLFASWPPAGTEDAQKHSFLAQITQINVDYSGGIEQYVKRAKKLLSFAVTGGNPYEGFTVSEPSDSVRLEEMKDFEEYELKGVHAAHRTGFVIVAGGLGERLGYKGIKLALPADTTTMKPYIQLYIEWILALQQRARNQRGDLSLLLPLGIMTSDDTHTLTVQLLKENNNFGMKHEQLTVFKQGKVPSLLDNEAHFCLEEGQKYVLDTKPHGHGDVHMLLYKEGIVEKWRKEKQTEWIVFFQDTNGLVFHSIVAALGVSKVKGLEVNSITVPRVQGDAVGAICKLNREEGKKGEGEGAELPDQLTINVEYNQLEGLLGKGVKEPLVNGTNYSIYPGNINVLIFAAEPYLACLQKKQGVIAEFVNPKYNEDKQSFKKPTRLECMMQDYPKLLTKESLVGFTQFQSWTAFSAVKNALKDGAAKQKAGNAAEVAATGEMDRYRWYTRMMKQLGCKVEEGKKKEYRGVQVIVPPKIVFSPSFAVSQAELKSKLAHPDQIVIADPSLSSTFVIEGGEDVIIRSLKLEEGTLILKAVDNAHVTIENLTVKNKGWKLKEISEQEEKEGKIEQKWLVRGYTMEREEEEYYVFDKAGRYVLSDETKEQYRKPYPK